MHGQTILKALLSTRNVMSPSVTRIISEDAWTSTKINVDSIEPALFDCGNECFWPNLLQIILKKDHLILRVYYAFPYRVKYSCFYYPCVRIKKTPLKKLQKNHHEQITYYIVNTKTRNLEVSYVITRFRKIRKSDYQIFLNPSVHLSAWNN